MLEVSGQGVRVNFFEVPEFGDSFRLTGGRGGRKLHGDGLVIRHAQIIDMKVIDRGRVGDD